MCAPGYTRLSLFLTWKKHVWTQKLDTRDWGNQVFLLTFPISNNCHFSRHSTGEKLVWFSSRNRKCFRHVEFLRPSLTQTLIPYLFGSGRSGAETVAGGGVVGGRPRSCLHLAIHTQYIRIFFRNFISCTSFWLQPQLLKVIASSAESKPGVNYQIIRHLLALHVLSKISSYISAEKEKFQYSFFDPFICSRIVCPCVTC